MQIVIDIPEDVKAVIDRNGTNEIIAETLWQATKNGTPHETVTEFADRCRECGREKVLNKIRAEIEKPLHDERCFDTADAKAQYIALNWCIEIIDKYRAKNDDEWDRVTMIDVDGNTHKVIFKKEIEG